jgi:uncharacterized protein YqgV (UPF0045/DUF77 family)
MPDDQVQVKITGTDEASPAFAQGAASADDYASKLTSLGSVFDSFTDRIAANVQAQQDAASQMSSMGAGLDAWADQHRQATAAAEALKPAVQAVGEEAQKAGGMFEGFAEKVGDFIKHPLEAAGDTATSFLETLGPVGAGITVVASSMAFLGKETYDLVNEEGAAARGTQNFANMLGLGFEQTKKLGEMARIVDADVGGLARASFRLAEALEDPTGAGKKQAEALKEIGVTATDTGGALLQVLQNLSEIPDKTKRVEEAHVLLGRASFQIMPLIENYDRLSEAIDSLGGVVDERGVQSMIEAREKINELAIAWDHLKEGFAAKLSPIVEMVVNVVRGMVSDEGEDSAKQGTLAGAISSGFSGISTLAKGWGEAVWSGFSTVGKAQLAALRAVGSMPVPTGGKPEPGFMGPKYDPLSAATSAAAAPGLAVAQKSADALAAAADRWKAGQAGSLEGLKAALSMAEDADKKLVTALEKPGAFTASGAAEEVGLRKQIAEIHEKIKAAEKSESGSGVAEKNAALEKQIEGEKKVALLGVDIRRDADKATLAIGKMSAEERQWFENEILVRAENERYEIERKAAEKVAALKAATAKAEHKPAEVDDTLAVLAAQHTKTLAELGNKDLEAQDKNNDAMVKNMQEFWNRVDSEGQKSFEKELALGKRRMEEANRAAEIMANAEIAHATRVYDANKASVEDDAKNHRISQAAKVQQLKDLETQEYKSQAGSAMGELTKAQTAGPMGGPDLGAVAAAQAKIQALNDKYLAAMAKLNIESKTAMTTMQDTMVKGITSISSAFDSGFNSWIKGGKSFAASMAQSFREMADQMIMHIERAVTQMIAQAIIHKLVGTEMGMTDARTAFKNTYAAVTAIPVVGPYLAPEAAAAAFAAVAGFAEKGADMPSTGGPFPMFLHKGEKVLTADQTKNYNSGGNTVNHHYNVAYHAAAGESPGSIMANKSQLKKLMREVIRPYAPAGQAAF